MLPITFLVQTAFNPVGAYLQKRWNVKLIMLLGSAIMLGAIYCASISTNWWMFVFFYSFVFPIGIGLVYWTPIICCWEWFPEKKGFMTGLIVGAFGLGAFFFGFITTAIVNPDNERLDTDAPKPHYYSEDVANRVPQMF
jgi:MFS family permease